MGCSWMHLLSCCPQGVHGMQLDHVSTLQGHLVQFLDLLTITKFARRWRWLAERFICTRRKHGGQHFLQQPLQLSPIFCMKFRIASTESVRISIWNMASFKHMSQSWLQHLKQNLGSNQQIQKYTLKVWNRLMDAMIYQIPKFPIKLFKGF